MEEEGGGICEGDEKGAGLMRRYLSHDHIYIFYLQLAGDISDEPSRA